MFKKLWKKGAAPVKDQKGKEVSDPSKVAPLLLPAPIASPAKTTTLFTDNARFPQRAKERRKASVEDVDIWDLMHDIEEDEETPAVGELRKSIQESFPHLSKTSPKPDKQEIASLVRTALKQVLDPETGKDFAKGKSGQRFIKEVLPLSAPLSRQTSPKGLSPGSDTSHSPKSFESPELKGCSKSSHGRRLGCALSESTPEGGVQSKRVRSGLYASKSTGDLQALERQDESKAKRRIEFPSVADAPKPPRRRALSLNSGPSSSGGFEMGQSVKQETNRSLATKRSPKGTIRSSSLEASVAEESAVEVRVEKDVVGPKDEVKVEEPAVGAEGEVNTEPEEVQSEFIVHMETLSLAEDPPLERSLSQESSSSSSGGELPSRRSSDASLADAFAFGSPVPHAEPVFDPEMLASFEEDLQRLSEEEWHAKKEAESASGVQKETDNRGGAAGVSGQVLQGKDELEEVMNEVEDFLTLLEQRAGDVWEEGGSTAGQKGLNLPPLQIPEPAAPVPIHTPPPVVGADHKPLLKAAASPKPGGKPPLSPPRCLKAAKPLKEVTSAPPRGLDRVVLYTTSVRAVRKTFEDCNSARAVFLGHGVAVDERDISMHGDFRDELRGLMGGPVAVPQVFIRGKYVGGFDEVQRLNDNRELLPMLEGMERQRKRSVCGSCGDLRFHLCPNCNGSCRVVSPTSPLDIARCPSCNENGLQMCQACA